MPQCQHHGMQVEATLARAARSLQNGIGPERTGMKRFLIIL
jgi:hypothetical protein